MNIFIGIILALISPILLLLVAALFTPKQYSVTVTQTINTSTADLRLCKNTSTPNRLQRMDYA